MRDSAGRGGGLDLVVLLEAVQSVQEAYAPAEQDRDHRDVHVIDEPGGKVLRGWPGGVGAGELSRRLAELLAPEPG